MKLLPFYVSILLISFSLGQVGRISFSDQIINGYYYELVMGIGFLWLVWEYSVEPLVQYGKKLIPELAFLTYLILLFVGTAFMYSFSENSSAFLYIVRLGFYAVFFLYGYHHVQRYRISRNHIHNSLYILLTISIVSSIIQYFLYPDLRNIFYLGWDPHLYRVVGLFFDPPVAATIFALLMMYIVFNWRDLHGHTWIKIMVCIVLVGLIFFTYSRGAYLAGVITVVAMLCRLKYAKYAVLVVPMVVIILLLLPKKFGEGVNLLRISTINSRMVDYAEGIRIWQTNPLTGIGYNRIRSFKAEGQTLLNKPTHSGASFHSSFLIVLATSGIVGIAIFMWILWRAQHISMLMQYSLLFSSIISLTDNVLLHPFILFTLMMFAVVSYGQKDASLLSYT